MAFVLVDPLTHDGARVDAAGALKTRSVTISELEDASVVNGLAFIWASQTYDPDMDDTILLVKNTGDKDLHIDSIWLSCDTDTRALVHLPVAEVTPAGTAIVGVNLNTGSANVAEASAMRDETDNTQGLVVWSGEIKAAGDPYEVVFGGALVLVKNKSVGVDYPTASAAADVTIEGHFV